MTGIGLSPGTATAADSARRPPAEEWRGGACVSGDAGEESASRYPGLFSCPVCGRKYRAEGPGAFRCRECRTALSLDQTGRISIDESYADDRLELRFREIEGLDGGLEIGIVGQLDADTQPMFRERVMKAIGEGYTRLSFDCGGLAWISSNAIGSFTAILKALGAERGAMVLIRPQAKVREVFELLGFTRFFRFVDSSAAAAFYLKDTPATAAFATRYRCPRCSADGEAQGLGRMRCPACGSSLRVLASGRAIEW
jgi:anti-anti-sigma factor